MPLMRNPFRSRPNDQVADENVRPGSGRADSSLGKMDSWSSRTKPLSVRTSSSGHSDSRPTEYKMSEINDSGAFLPPSPTEKKATFWPTRSGTSTRSSSTYNDNEPFNISRESFDSYRRSFDITARSPVMAASTPPRPRQSLDTRALRMPPASPSAKPPKHFMGSDQLGPPRRPSATPYQPKPVTLPDKHVHPPSSQPDEPEDAQSETSPSTSATTDGVSTNPTTPADSNGDQFEDVGLGDPAAVGQIEAAEFKKPPPPQKKPSIFARFGGSTDTTHKDENSRPSSSHGSGLGIGLGMFGRKRGASGQGAELGSLPQTQNKEQSSPLGHSKRSSIGNTQTVAGTPEVKTDA